MKRTLRFCCIVMMICENLVSKEHTTNTIFSINFNSTDNVLFHHFWKSTGLCPMVSANSTRDYLLGPGERTNLRLIASMPNKAVEYVRIHWLMDLLTFEGSDKKPNFKYLDEMLDFLHGLRLKPIFEIMGRSLLSYSKNDMHHVSYWSGLVHSIISRYIDRYGLRTVRSWKFETWNEPDLKGYNVLNFTLQDYLNYVTGCAEGLKSAFRIHGTIESGMAGRLGGPAGLFRNANHPLCWGLLESCKSVKSAAECPIQFLSFHRKGDSDVAGVLNGTLEMLKLFEEKFPDLEWLPFANDESDILKNWSNNEEWRADVRYAAMITQVIIRTYKEIILEKKRSIELLSFDNAFMNYHPYYFTQRTLLARFQMNLTSPPHDQFVRKPVYSAMGLLSYMGNEFMKEVVVNENKYIYSLSTRLRTSTHSSFSFILAYANDTWKSSTRETVEIILTDLVPRSRYVIYILNNTHTNPYEVWKTEGSPVYPPETTRNKMMEHENPLRLSIPTEIGSTELKLSVQIGIPTFLLIHICSKTRGSPKKIVRLQVHNITWNEVLVIWSDEYLDNLCIRTYEVEFESRCENKGNGWKFRRVNPNDIIFLSYHHATTGDRGCEATKGRYRVRAVDYWDRAGHYSEIVPYPAGLY